MAASILSGSPSVPTLLSPIGGKIMVDLVDPTTGSSLVALADAVNTTIHASFNDWTRCHHVFRFSDIRVLNQVSALLQKPISTVLYKLGVLTETGPVWKTAETHVLTVDKAFPSAQASTNELVVETADTLFLLNRTPHVLPRKGTASQIVTQIAAGYGMKAVCANTSYVLSLIQSFNTDMDFIVRRLIPRTISTTQQTDFRLQQRANSIVYGPINFTGRQPNIWVVDAQNRQVVGEVTEADHSQLCAQIGSGGVRSVVANPFSLNNQSQTSTPDAATQLGGANPSAPPSYGYYSIPVTLYDDPNEALAIAQNVYARNRADMYEITFIAYGAPQMEIGDYITFTSADLIFNTSSTGALTTGLSSYCITWMKIQIEKGNIRTLVRATRGQLTTATGLATTLSPGTAQWAPQYGTTATPSAPGAPAISPATTPLPSTPSTALVPGNDLFSTSPAP